MKSLLWILCAALGLVAAAVVTSPGFDAKLRQNCLRRTAQPPEAQALLAHEWARAHALAGH